MNKDKVVATLIQLDRSDVSELETISAQYSELLSDMERLINEATPKTEEKEEVTMFVPRIEKD